MPMEVITTNQLKYYRLVSDNDQKSLDRWTQAFSWYPVRQNIEFSHIAEIYGNSRQRYGDELFQKYAALRRLNSKHTTSTAHVSLEKLEEKELFEKDQNVNSNAKVPPTTNGEYGRFKPTRMHSC